MRTAERLRAACVEIRRKPYPIKDLVPLLQQAADDLDLMDNALMKACGDDPEVVTATIESQR